MAQPEKLNLWDRFFNRYRKEIVEEGEEKWTHLVHGVYGRNYVKYKIIDRLTGSETIQLDYLN